MQNIPMVSLCLVVKDEEKYLDRCLTSVKHLVEEIIVVDTGSTDQTVAIAKKAGGLVFDWIWDGNFSAARNFSLNKASGDWILILDADEELESTSRQSLRKLLSNDSVEGYFLQVKNQLGSGEEVAWDQAVRLFRNNRRYRFSGVIHEQAANSILEATSGQGLAHAPLVINHYGYLDTCIKEKDKLNRNISLIKNALKHSPNDPFLLYCLGLEYYRQNNISTGLNCLEQALLNLTGAEGYFEDALCQKALGLYATEQLSQLLEFLNNALTMFPEHPVLRAYRGCAYSCQGKYSEALVELKYVLQDKSNKFPTPLLQDLIAKAELNIKELAKPKSGEKRVLIASPVKQRAAILTEFLTSIAALSTRGLAVDILFLDDNDDPQASALLKSFTVNNANIRIVSAPERYAYLCDETTHHWCEDLIWRVAKHKNTFIKFASEEHYDYLFLVDSDLYLHPLTLEHLISLNRDIVAEVFWTKWEPTLPRLPQVWLTDQYLIHAANRNEILSETEISTRTTEFLQMLQRPGTYKVGGLGACTLISKKALNLGVSFKEIYNLSFVGEDRHFCVRAVALGLELYADTHYPPYHIYRESELDGLEEYKRTLSITEVSKVSDDTNNVSSVKQIRTSEVSSPAGSKEYGQSSSLIIPRKNRITLAMLVRNEASRYLSRVLHQVVGFIDNAVIVDDASEDSTVEVCRKILGSVSLQIDMNSTSGFHNETALRQQLWNLAISTNPDWILILDADEFFEDNFHLILQEIERPDIYSLSFRLYDMWSETHYREDEFWSAHQTYRPLMVRYIPGFVYEWQETPLHCGRFPKNTLTLPGAVSQLRIQHLGWAKSEDKLKKYFRYQKLDPDACFGIPEQYESILDPHPNLIPWAYNSPNTGSPVISFGPETTLSADWEHRHGKLGGYSEENKQV